MGNWQRIWHSGWQQREAGGQQAKSRLAKTCGCAVSGHFGQFSTAAAAAAAVAGSLGPFCSTHILPATLSPHPASTPLDLPPCSGPREDATRIGSAGVVRRQAVDVSPLRRVNQAIWLITTGARESAFRNIKTIAECLADELINAAKGSSNRCGAARWLHVPWLGMRRRMCGSGHAAARPCSSPLCSAPLRRFLLCHSAPACPCPCSYAIKKKDELERVAKANR